MNESDQSAGSAPRSEPDHLLETAADWLARREGGFTAEEQEQFSNWILANERHAAAIKNVECAWRFMQKPRRAGQSEEVLRRVEQRVQTLSRVRRRRARFTCAIGMAAAAGLVVAFVSLGGRKAGSSPPVAASVEFKPERQILPDGSVIELNAGAEVALDFAPQQRRVRLVRGEAHFAVAKDRERPFIVTAGAVSVRALGTQFVLRLDPATVEVLVTEGRVAVERVEVSPALVTAPPISAPTVLEAGTKTVVPIAIPLSAALEVQPVAAAEIQTALAWRNRRVEFTAMPLHDVVRWLNQHNEIQISVRDAGLEEIRISGIFWLDDAEGFSRLIAASAELRATRKSPTSIVIERP